jgi:hypothetical protein
MTRIDDRLNWTPQVWETVNIVVNPTKISLNVGARLTVYRTEAS